MREDAPQRFIAYRCSRDKAYRSGMKEFVEPLRNCKRKGLVDKRREHDYTDATRLFANRLICFVPIENSTDDKLIGQQLALWSESRFSKRSIKERLCKYEGRGP